MALITISQNFGSGGLEIARLAADKLDLELYDDPKLQMIALEAGIQPEDLASIDEKAPGWFDRILSHRPDTYLEFMESVVYEVARHGRGIILGHGSQMFLRDFDCALHVRIYAKEDSRIETIRKEQGLDAADARQQGFFRFAFHERWDDPSLYDLIINTEKLGVEASAATVIVAAQDQRINECSLTALDTMERMALTKQVEAELLKMDVDLKFLTIEAQSGGTVNISGLVVQEVLKKRISDIVRNLPGVDEVRNRVVTMPGGI